ncbi:MAG TPA: allantoicase [Micromonosporaceae bacterium]|nr:allantoicase [Micromonosporaceae bacterium]
MSDLPDLASRALGGGAVWANDEFFAAADNLVNPEPPGFRPRTFGPKGQVYDGWETRRRREPGHDDAVLRLGVPGLVRAVVVDTAHFTGNYPPEASVDGCCLDGYPGPDDLARARWFPLVPRSPLGGDARNEFSVNCPSRVTHVRLRIYPDGGVARLRVHGEALPDPDLLPEVLDLASVEHGGRVVGCSDMFYGSPGNLLLPGPARSMGEGWETRRRRDDANDWVEVRLAGPGVVELAELDTGHFKGNAPGRAALRGLVAGAGGTAGTGGAGYRAEWRVLLPEVALRPDTRHRFRVPAGPAVTRVRLDVYPDGGMARLRLLGRFTPEGLADLTARWRAATASANG